MDLPHLPPDILVEILSRVTDTVTIIRCAATCKPWRGLMHHPSFLSHHLHPPPLLGFFYRDTSRNLTRRRLYRRRPTRFLLLSSSPSQQPHILQDLSRFFLPVAVTSLEGFVPVASSAGGLLALRRSPASSCDPVRICVCNPAAGGASSFLPPLPHLAFPVNITFLDDEAGDSSSLFRLLAVMNHQQGLLLRVFSSETGDWGASMTVQLPANMVVIFGSPAVVLHRDAVHWICSTRALPNRVHALALYLGVGEAAPLVRRIDLPLRAGINRLVTALRAVRLTKNSAQGSLSLVLLDEPVLSIWNLEGDSISSDGNSLWSLHKKIHLMSLLPSAVFDPSIQWGLSVKVLCHKSGSLFLHAVGEGLFVLNLDTEMITRVCKDDFAQYVCPYVADLGSCLAAMKSF